MKHSRQWLVVVPFMFLAGCGGLLESTMPPVQSYVLRAPERDAAASNSATIGSLLVQRPEAGPGLNSDRIALLRGDHRFDSYAASRWAAPVPDLLASLLVTSLRDSNAFAAVHDDAAPFAPVYTLRVNIRRFEADYTAGRGGAPTVYVVLDCTLGRHRDRVWLKSFVAQASVAASEDRLNAIVAAFEAATVAALREVEQVSIATLESR